MIAMSNDNTTLMNREERIGKRYPLWIERFLLVGAIAVFVLGRSTVAGIVDAGVVRTLLTYIVFPMVLLACVELLGRAIQGSGRS